jgi:hypothetical protein
VQKLVGLHDHGVPRSALLSPARGAWRWEVEHLATDHCLRGWAWCEVGHLLSNDPHLLAIGFVRGEAAHFLS